MPQSELGLEPSSRFKSSWVKLTIGPRTRRKYLELAPTGKVATSVPPELVTVVGETLENGPITSSACWRMYCEQLTGHDSTMVDPCRLTPRATEVESVTVTVKLTVVVLPNESVAEH